MPQAISQASCVASASLNNSPGSFGPEKMLDGNTGTIWSSAVQANPSANDWFKIDTGSSRSLVQLVWSNGDITHDVANSKVQISSDNSSWTDVGSPVAQGDLVNIGGQWTHTVTFTATTGRYLRVLCTTAGGGGTAGANGWRVAEMVASEAIPAPTCGNFTCPSAGTTLTATLSQSGLTPGSGSGDGGFTVSGLIGHAVTVTSWSISGTTLTLVLSAPIRVGDTNAITVDYDGSAAITNGDNALASFSGKSVTNNSTFIGASVPTRNFFGLM